MASKGRRIFRTCVQTFFFCSSAMVEATGVTTFNELCLVTAPLRVTRTGQCTGQWSQLNTKLTDAQRTFKLRSSESTSTAMPKGPKNPRLPGDLADECALGQSLLAQGQFEQLEKFYEERVMDEEGSSSTEDIPLFLHCHSIILVTKSLGTGEEEDRKAALEMVEACVRRASQHVPQVALAKRVAKWGMSFVKDSAPKITTAEELSSRIILAEGQLLSAMLLFMDESISSFFKALMLMQQAVSGFRTCQGLLDKQDPSERNIHDVEALRCCFGAFNLITACLPPKILRLLAILGIKPDKDRALLMLRETLNQYHLRFLVGVFYLLLYHIFLPSFLSIPQLLEDHVARAKEVLTLVEDKFDNPVFVRGVFGGRLKRLEGKSEEALKIFEETDRAVQFPITSPWHRIQHMVWYEMGYTLIMLLQWKAAKRHWEALSKESGWSKAFFAYVTGICCAMEGDAKGATTLFAKVPELLRKRKMLGRELAEEQFVVKQVRDFGLDHLDGVNGPFGALCGIEYLYTWNSFPQMPRAQVLQVLSLVDDHRKKNWAGRAESWVVRELDLFCQLVRGVCLRCLGQMEEAHHLLIVTHEACKAQVSKQLYLVPYSAYEVALTLINTQVGGEECEGGVKSPHSELECTCNQDVVADKARLTEARKWLKVAEGFKKDYSFMWRLLGRVHAAQTYVKEQLQGAQRQCPKHSAYTFSPSDESSGGSRSHSGSMASAVTDPSSAGVGAPSPLGAESLPSDDSDSDVFYSADEGGEDEDDR
eukprot:jgi/Mesvir1/5873/Mv00652-RA.1